MIHAPRILFFALLFCAGFAQAQSPEAWEQEFPIGDFSCSVINVSEIEFDGNTRDSIPPIDDPFFARLAEIDLFAPFEPVISLTINGDARAYPLQIMLWHEIVNDTVGGQPVLITYCPLCNSGVVFERSLNGQLLDFGNSGRLRNLDMVMYDRQTESWWQQFTGRSIIGALAGQTLVQIPSRIESIASFETREPDGLVLVPEKPNARPYGTTPFAGMDTRRASGRFSHWPLPSGINPMQYVVVADGKAWPLARIRDLGQLNEAGLNFKWTAGRNSLHDQTIISNGRDVGNITVQNADGSDAVYDLVFAFAFAAFMPGNDWMLGK